jgi:Na+/H+-dicarboxylate symporter
MPKKLLSTLKNTSLPTRLVVVILSAVFLGNFLSWYQAQFIYTFSLFFKEILSFFLPFVVIAFVLSGILSLKKNAPLALLMLIGVIIVSNFCTSLVAFFSGKLLIEYISEGIKTAGLHASISMEPLWAFTLRPLIAPERALLLALTLGLTGSFFSVPSLENFTCRFKEIIEKILNHAFIPLLPIYVLGFLLKIIHEGALATLFESYGKTCLFFIIVQNVYQLFLYFVTAGFSLSKAMFYIKNSMPSYVTAFGTMSSSSTIPVTIQCMKKNIDNPSFAEMATPILANMHLAGDCISVPILALTTLFIFTGTIPTFLIFIKFIFYFCLTMLAATGVPGGGIIVMIPILKSILGFSPEMVGIITTLYLVTDGFSTACNVMGDNALAILVNKLLKKINVF